MVCLQLCKYCKFYKSHILTSAGTNTKKNNYKYVHLYIWMFYLQILWSQLWNTRGKYYMRGQPLCGRKWLYRYCSNWLSVQLSRVCWSELWIKVKYRPILHILNTTMFKAVCIFKCVLFCMILTAHVCINIDVFNIAVLNVFSFAIYILFFINN